MPFIKINVDNIVSAITGRLIAKGILYATAEISFQAKNDNNQSNIKVVLSQGDNNVTFTTSYNNKENLDKQPVFIDDY